MNLRHHDINLRISIFGFLQKYPGNLHCFMDFSKHAKLHIDFINVIAFFGNMQKNAFLHPLCGGDARFAR